MRIRFSSEISDCGKFFRSYGWGMLRSLIAAILIFVPTVPLSGEVELEIHTDRNIVCRWPAKGEFGYLLELRTYQAAPGKLDALLARFRDHTVKLFEKHGMINVAYWVPVDNKDSRLVYLLAYRDRQSRDASWKAFMEDPDWTKAAADSETDGKLVAKVDSVFLKPTDFSEGFSGLGKGKAHLFEMRTYTAMPGRLPNLHSRFRDHTLALFGKHGMTNLAYFQPADGQPAADDTLVYFLAHNDLDSATKSWAGFRADPDWLAAKKASENKAGGSLTAEGGVVSVFLKPTDFSPVK
jgi:hypothetical protein